MEIIAEKGRGALPLLGSTGNSDLKLGHRRHFVTRNFSPVRRFSITTNNLNSALRTSKTELIVETNGTVGARAALKQTTDSLAAELSALIRGLDTKLPPSKG
jgi:DNA-directed RNA polymerase alpha subunit